MKKELNYEETVKKVGVVTIIWNVILSLVKVIFGFLCNTESLVSDGIHSASDVFSTIVVMIGAKISKKEADEDHPFGHERIESVASILLAIILGFTAILLGYKGIDSIVLFSKGELEITLGSSYYLALFFAVASILIKGWMYFYTINAAKKINSVGLKADAYHHLSDSLSSIASVLGVIGLIIGGKFVLADYIASIIISLFILKVSYDIGKDAFEQLIDKAAPKEVVEELIKIANSIKGVISVRDLRSRVFGSMYYVEIDIVVDGDLTVKQGHDIGHDVRLEIEKQNKFVKHCLVHVDPERE